MTAYIKSKKFHKSRQNRGLVILSMVIVVSVLGLAFLYLIQTNSLVSCSYQIREYKKKIRELKAENQQLEMEITQWQSPVNLEELVNSLKMIETGQVVYLEEEKAVAVNE
jgi:cell division protein FtsB